MAMTLTVKKSGMSTYQACLTVPGYVTECHYSSSPTKAATSIVKRMIGNLHKSGGFLGYSKSHRKIRRQRRGMKRRG